MKKLAEAAGLDIVSPAEAAADTDTFTATVTAMDTATVTATDTVTATVPDPLPVAPPEPVSILPPPAPRVVPKHPWFGEPPARLLAKLLDAWKLRVEKRIAARAPWIARLVARYGPAFMQQRKPVE